MSSKTICSSILEEDASKNIKDLEERIMDWLDSKQIFKVSPEDKKIEYFSNNKKKMGNIRPLALKIDKTKILAHKGYGQN